MVRTGATGPPRPIEPPARRLAARAALLGLLLAPAAAAAHESPGSLAQHRGAAAAVGALVTAALAAGAMAALRERHRSRAIDRARAEADAERVRLGAQLEAVTRQANDMIFVADESLRLLDANDRAASALGYEREELLGMSVRDLRDPGTAGDLDGMMRPELGQRALLFETRYRRKDGSTFPVELSVRVTPVGERRFLFAIARDLTERRRAEEALRESEAKFRATFESAGVGIALLDGEGRIREANRALRTVAGSTEEGLRGRALAELAALDPETQRAIGALLAGERDVLEAPCRWRRPDGSEVDAVLRARAGRGRSGSIERVVALVEDVTERKRYEAQLLLADRLASVGTLAAGVAHEINNPLAFVLANLDVSLEVLRERGGPEEVRRALEDAREGASRVREIVRDLRTFARDRGETRTRLDVRRTLRSSINLALPEIRRRARLEVDLAEVPPVLGAEHRLGQVFLNLLVNAAQAIPEGAAERQQIRVATREDAGRVLVEVTDTGAGIPTEILPRIFDPFFTTKPVGVGTGLGLAIVHAIVADLGGEVRVRSVPGQGSTFEVDLPASPDPAGVVRSPAVEPAQVRIGRILLVDDEPLVGRAVARVLSPPHEVVLAESGSDALARIERGDRAFDLVLCDLMMPGMSGMDLHERLRSVAPELLRRLVFLTGGASHPGARAFLERAQRPFVEKPFDPPVLRRVVSAILAA
jgi:PAS domain S-box-containing protein